MARKRKPGRPKGSKNKKRKPGRPKGSKNKVHHRRPGRPKGSKNKKGRRGKKSQTFRTHGVTVTVKAH